MTTPTPPQNDEVPEPGSVWVEEHEPPRDEAQREALETIRSVSRLEEAN